MTRSFWSPQAIVTVILASTAVIAGLAIWIVGAALTPASSPLSYRVGLTESPPTGTRFSTEKGVVSYGDFAIGPTIERAGGPYYCFGHESGYGSPGAHVTWDRCGHFVEVK